MELQTEPTAESKTASSAISTKTVEESEVLQADPSPPTEADKKRDEYYRSSNPYLRILSTLEIERYGQLFLNALASSPPPTVNQPGMWVANIYGAIFSGQIQCWGILDEPEPGRIKLLGFVLTRIIDDTLEVTRSLQVYYVWSPEEIFLNPMHWKKFGDILIGYAKHEKCRLFVTYTDKTALIMLGKSWGANCDMHVCFREVN